MQPGCNAYHVVPSPSSGRNCIKIKPKQPAMTQLNNDVLHDLKRFL
jgi:hypothetical protein